MRPLISLLLLLALLTGCEVPTAEFDAFKLPRAVNLARVLGPAPVLLGEQDTLALRLQFDAATGLTDFRLRTDSVEQPWLTARAFRFRGLYYLVEEQPDSGYWVHAVRIRRGQVQGLGTGYEQMRKLSAGARQGRWPELVRFRNLQGDSLRLRFDQQLLRAFYATEVDSFATYQLAAASAVGAGAKSVPTVGSALLPSIYPNPAQTTTTVNFGEAATRQVQLHDARGRLLHSYPVSTPQLALSVAELRNGTYLVRIHTAGQARPTTLRLLISR